MQGVHVPHSHMNVCLCSLIVCPYTFLLSMEQIINQRVHVHTHIIPRVSKHYQRQEYVLSLKHDSRGEIEGDNKHRPTSVWGSRHSMRIEPNCCQCNTYITRLPSFLTMMPVKILPCFSIGWMYHVLRMLLFAFFVPCHLFSGFLGHVKPLDPRYERKVP